MTLSLKQRAEEILKEAEVIRGEENAFYGVDDLKDRIEQALDRVRGK